MFFKSTNFCRYTFKIEIKIDPILGVVHCCVCPVFLAAIFALRSCCFSPLPLLVLFPCVSCCSQCDSRLTLTSYKQF
jgi:hypothetical protein